MAEVEWLSIGPCAAKFEIEVPRLRVWCDKGLIEYDKRSTGRWIPTTEFPKIEKIKEIFSRGGNITFDDVKEELIKDNLFRELKTNAEEEQAINEMAANLEKAFERSGATAFFSTIATEFNSLTHKVDTLTEAFEKQNQMQEQLLLEDKSKMEKLEEDNAALKGLFQQFLTSDNDIKSAFAEYMKDKDSEREKQAELVAKLERVESQLSQINQRKGFFSKLFGKK
ncbi:hypothetical protein [Bacillus mycoides]|uniref:hypothetical protein n=1 Tax=Bacillus mycoides TaxID=1405 RepID=UPI000991F8E9|nr:hypothetical protein [Bacillus mycoides]OOR15770.1 hypothetical protein BW891_24530 [Bacillus mycoides]